MYFYCLLGYQILIIKAIFLDFIYRGLWRYSSAWNTRIILPASSNSAMSRPTTVQWVFQFTCSVIFCSIIFRLTIEQHTNTSPLYSLGTIIGHALDVKYSPVQAALLMLPPNVPDWSIQPTRALVALGILGVVLMVGWFGIMIQLTGCPKGSVQFNV